MAPKHRIIIDTDPGVDDIIAILLALSASPDEIEVLLISLTFGNIDVQNCLRNIVTLFHVIERELDWRRRHGLPEGFESLKSNKPTVAVGADRPLVEKLSSAAHFHGADGLGGVHASLPHFTAPFEDAWRALFDHSAPVDVVSASVTTSARAEEVQKQHLFTPSRLPSHKEILRVLRENPLDTITILAIGPLTNLALAATEDPETFLRVKEVVCMGGVVDNQGNITPFAEFNTHADAAAAARIFALTSPTPSSTMPPASIGLADYPSELFQDPASRRLKLALFTLDITMQHLLYPDEFNAFILPFLSPALDEDKSPLAEWTSSFLGATFAKALKMRPERKGALYLHDQLTVWYLLNHPSTSDVADPNRTGWTINEAEDIRVEAVGQWTRGAMVIDRRGRQRGGEIPGDRSGWLHELKGNRINRVIRSPRSDTTAFAGEMLRRIYGTS